MSCLDNIVTSGLCADDPAPLSGYTLMMAPGMSPKNLSNIANENYVEGKKLADIKKQLAISFFKNDFIGALQANRVVTYITDPIYDSSRFNTNVAKGLYSGERGITLHTNGSYRGRLRTTFIKNVQVYPLTTGAGDIKVYDGFNVTSYPVTFVANQLNTFAVNYTLITPNARVVINNTVQQFCSSPITCMRGCNNTLPNICGWCDGWDGTKPVKAEAFGISLQFYCHCNYEQILCDLGATYSGELIWLKWQYLIYDEQFKTNRFAGWTTYNRDELKQTILPDLEAQYVAKWNALMDGLFAILQTYRDDCLNCRGIKWRPNI